MAASDKSSSSPLFRISLILLQILVVTLSVLIPSLYFSNTEMLISRIENQYKAGDIASADVTASHTFFFLDEDATAEDRNEAAFRTLPIFTFSIRETEDNLLRIESQIEQVIIEGIISYEEKNRVRNLLYELVEELFALGIFDERELAGLVSDGYQDITVRARHALSIDGDETVPIDSCITTENLASVVLSEEDLFDRLGLFRYVQELVDILEKEAQPTVLYNSVVTRLERERAVQEVPPVMLKVEEGQQIIQKNHLITDQMVKTLKAMQLIAHRFTGLQNIGRILFSLIITIAATYLMGSVFAHSKRREQFILIFLLGLIITLILTFFLLYSKFSGEISFLDPLLPVFFLPLFLSILTGRKRAGMIGAVTLASYMSLFDQASVLTFFFIIGVSFIAVYFIRYVSRRIDMIFQWVITIVTAVAILIIHMLVLGNPFDSGGVAIGILIINITFSYLILTFLLPLLEVLFNVPTPFRLRELASGRSANLTRLASLAPGTYAHSMNVAEYAQEAAKEIGADELLTYVGALYHDIGKQEHPEYFIENQQDVNKHDDLRASLSTAIIKSHVKLGVEKAREAKLPQEVIDIIYQHHGTDVIQIFLNEALKEAELEKNTARVGEHEFSYNNEIPQTPEAAIVMLADSVEAASRSIVKPSHKKYERLVRMIVQSKIERGQLASSRLTMNDLEKIINSLIHSIIAKNHIRIKYPKDETEV